jgi:anti-sigma regulatory factor (Ser/Thr protein kinase)
MRFSGDVRAPGAARRFARSALAELAGDPGPGRADDVVLVVSELVTNCVRAGATDIGVTIAITDDCLELQVDDDASGWPSLHHASVDEVTGRGLEIVGKVADEWHTTPLDPGKRVTVTWAR